MSNSSPKKESAQNIRYLIVLISLLSAIGLGVTYLLGTNKTFLELFYASIPDAIIVLLAGPIIYFLFTRFDISVKTNRDKKHSSQIAKEVVNVIDKNYLQSSESDFITFHQSYKKVDWSRLIGNAQSSIDLVAYYFDSWAKNHNEQLVNFFQRPGTKLRLFVADPRQDEIVEEVNRLFPEYTRNEVEEKIVRSGKRFKTSAKSAGISLDRLEFYYVPYFLSYSAHCWDNRTLNLGWFEMYRKAGIESPIVEIDLNKAQTVRAFWVKELNGILKDAEQVSLEQSA